MTNEQAIKELQESHDIMRNHDIDESESYLMQALNMAIKALQEQADRNEFYNWDAPIRHKADGDLISRQAVQNYIAHFLSLYLQDNVREAVEAIDEVIGDMPSVAIPPEHDGCKDCRWQSQSETEMPCKQCKHNYTDEWEREKPTDTITMTREEFSEKLMEHYRQGRADEKAYQNGEIMQSFNPD